MDNTNFTYVIKQVELALRPYIDGACAAAGMTTAQYTALTVLERRPGITSSELARRSFVRAQTMAQTMDPLLEAGLVRRERDPGHARRLLLYLTDTGSAAIARARPHVAELERLILSEFTADEAAAFAEYLRRARRSLHESAPVTAS
ncbi:MarR family transcriptional regulator [Microbacterium sp. SYP-A9085]|uniref:MarR family winged helix-turn-helix transcriptional regulator n=1 Tax=Microbacterium sp. SYP-A9085 TaxID=2664454 RepID=UPI00129B7649|nr:MarR family transcriptional regulator [Microbacterium sp. SYP-A9085]MRH28996.1 MarR family transcriptional regulator [Microbacterium sp. SYP-A9085]